MLFAPHDKLIFAGDSVTDADRARPAGEGLFGAHGNGYVRDVAAMFDALYPQMDLRVINRGVSGDSVRHLAARWQQDVLDDHPDWVAVMIGVNRLIETTLPQVKGMILMTPYFLEPNRADPMRAELDKRGQVVKELAAQYDLPLVDVQAAFDKLLEHLYSAVITWDRVHPNYIGCALICKAFLNAVGFDWENTLI